MINEERIDTAITAGRAAPLEPMLSGDAPAKRLHAIDLARGIAVVAMIGTHATHAFMADAWKGTELWYAVNILFGFVAPAFAFLSGVTLWPALMRRSESLPDLKKPARDLLFRLFTILLLGYWLQTPNLSLRQLIVSPSAEELRRLFDANILQVIALSGILIVALAWTFRSLARARMAALLIGIAAIIATPYVWTSDLLTILPLPFRYYLAPQPPATFGLFPYLAYYLIGFAAAGRLIDAAGSTRRSITILIAGLVMITIGFAVDPFLAHIPPHDMFWGGSAQHAIFRIGGVIAMVAFSLLLARRDTTKEGWLAYLGKRSLGVYILHLMLIYGSPVTKGMRYWFSSAEEGHLAPFDATLAPWTTTILGIAILALCYVALKGWDRLKRTHPTAATWCARLFWVGFWGIFLLKP